MTSQLPKFQIQKRRKICLAKTEILRTGKMSEADLTAELNFDKKKKKKKPMKLDDDEMASLEQRKSKI